ncbi:hypothetical protein BAG01nite_42810 [Brevibacillus agri]|uniref:Uncharacterized protein n=1 Tax=Brevibacillus agri TaxID=51101 RepID=A0ABQ0SW76_9BACL|nr:hypothetical protein BAG01nite_42810 [Brevibacillus agri]
MGYDGQSVMFDFAAWSLFRREHPESERIGRRPERENEPVSGAASPGSDVWVDLPGVRCVPPYDQGRERRRDD